MTSPRDPDGSRRIETDSSRTEERFTPTAAGAGVTGRMTGTDSRTDVVSSTDRDRTGATGAPHAKTSAAAAFGLVFGISALICALTAILAPAAVVLGIIGLVVSIAGMAMAKRPHVTGRGVAIGGLVTALLGLLLGGAVIGGLAAVVNNQKAVDRITRQIDKLKSQLPSGSEVKNTVDKTTS